MLNSEILLLATLILLLCLSASVTCTLGCCILGLLDSVSIPVPHLIGEHGKTMPFYKGVAQSQNISVHSTKRFMTLLIFLSFSQKIYVVFYHL